MLSFDREGSSKVPDSWQRELYQELLLSCLHTGMYEVMCNIRSVGTMHEMLNARPHDTWTVIALRREPIGNSFAGPT
jgi:hypothetical protein